MARNPFSEIERMLDRMSRQFEGVEESMFSEGAAVDVEDRGSEYVVTADLPGFDREDITVELSGETLTVRAERHDEYETQDEHDDARYLRRERRRRSVNRSVYLPDAVDADGTEATHRNGVLTVTLPKREAMDEGTDIPIN